MHAVIFNSLFSGLRDYYEKSGEGLDDTLADFWAQLLERAFPLLHPQYSFPPDFLLCLTRLTSTADGSLQPFGDSPSRLRLQISRALVAARALVQGLETGRNVVSEALKVRGALNMDRAQDVKKTGTIWQERPRAVPSLSVPGLWCSRGHQEGRPESGLPGVSDMISWDFWSSLW